MTTLCNVLYSEPINNSETKLILCQVSMLTKTQSTIKVFMTHTKAWKRPALHENKLVPADTNSTHNTLYH